MGIINKLSESDREILLWWKDLKPSKMTRARLIERFDFVRSTAYSKLRKLVNLGICISYGSGNGTFYRLTIEGREVIRQL